MTKLSPNPRRYSRGPQGLDPAQPFHVYFALRVPMRDLTVSFRRIAYVWNLHRGADISIDGYRRDLDDVILTIKANVGPAREALSGDSEKLSAAFDLFWDLARIMFYATPMLVTEPHESEQLHAKELEVSTILSEYVKDAEPLACVA